MALGDNVQALNHPTVAANKQPSPTPTTGFFPLRPELVVSLVRFGRCLR